MQAILPGKPQAQLQAVSTGLWEGQLVVAYVSGTALVILNGSDSLLQTIYNDESASDGLQTVAYDERTGKIAAASTYNIYIYVLREEIKGQLQWTLELTLHLPDKNDHVRTLSWGVDEELLVGSANLALFSTHVPSTPGSPRASSATPDGLQPIWSRALASPVTHAATSPSASLVATCAVYHRLVKIWRRLSFESPLFDYAYLRHPAVVTHLEWRRVGHEEGGVGEEEVLYTICADGKFRVWKTGEPHGIEILSLEAEIDMLAAIQPRDPKNTAGPTRRYAFVVPAHVFTAAVYGSVESGKGDGKRNKHALEHLNLVAGRNPEVVVVLDNQGQMSAWGLENVACKRRNSGIGSTHAFHVAQIEGLSLGLEEAFEGMEDNVWMLSLPSSRTDGVISLLAHHFDGRIQWWDGRVQDLFTSAKKSRIHKAATWTGHSAAIKKVIRTASGKALISRTQDNEAVVWTQTRTGTAHALRRKSKLNLGEHIHRTCLLEGGDFVVFLHHESISLWDTRQRDATEIARCEYQIRGKPLCLLVLPETDAHDGLIHLATISAEMKGIVWEISRPPVSGAPQQNGQIRRSPMRQFCTFDLGDGTDMAYFLPVDPAGKSPVVRGFLDSFAQDVAISYTTTGLLQTWTAKVNPENNAVDWLVTSAIETGIKGPSLGSGTSIRRAALVDQDRTNLTIWDTKGARLDYEETFTGQQIQDLDWASTPDDQSILAVGFTHGVRIYTQLRYDYVDERPSWACIKQVSIRDLTPHPIGDSVWFGSGNLVIGAGNQLFLASDTVDLSKELPPDLRMSAPHQLETRIHDVVRRLNGPLPVFHPQFISQCILAGKTALAQRILVTLYKTLKFYTEGDELDSFQGISIDEFSSDTESMLNANGTSSLQNSMQKSYSSMAVDEEPTTVTEEVANSLATLLTEKSVPQLSSREQLSLADVVECVSTVEKHRRSVDDNATRFLLFWRARILRSHQSATGTPKAAPSAAISWREIMWAYHSSSQDILVDLISRHHKGRLEWPQARDAGVFMWLTDREALTAQFEVVARNAYTATELKNPVDCSLYYLALRKKAVLLGLWRMATWSKEQAATMRLLRNDFTDPRWKTAAAKNAYALMGRRRFEYAAAFFLLADDLPSAIGILSNQLGDMQLAVAVARVYGGDDSPALKNFLLNRVLPIAAREGNRWQMSWAYWLMGERSLAVRALVSPLHTLLIPPGPPPESLRAKSFLNDDFALVVLYRQLREKSLQTLKGALMISGQEEWDFIIKTAALLRRMGCDILALDLVRNWEFLQQQPAPPPAKAAGTAADQEEEEKETLGELASPYREPKNALDGFDGVVDPRKLLRRRSSLVVADLPRPHSDAHAMKTPDVKPAASILDAWGMDDAPKAEKVGTSAVDKVAEAKRKVEEMKRKKAEKEMSEKKPPPTQFKEPDPNSLLDSFGF